LAHCGIDRALPGADSVPVMGTPDIGRVADLLHEAAETHHQVYRITDGSDDDWASWYADWLVRLSELPTLVGRPPVCSELVHLLVQADRDHMREHPDETWERFYARRILDQWGEPGT
jgi:hypothetical protein